MNVSFKEYFQFMRFEEVSYFGWENFQNRNHTRASKNKFPAIIHVLRDAIENIVY